MNIEKELELTLDELMAKGLVEIHPDDIHKPKDEQRFLVTNLGKLEVERILKEDSL